MVPTRRSRWRARRSPISYCHETPALSPYVRDGAREGSPSVRPDQRLSPSRVSCEGAGLRVGSCHCVAYGVKLGRHGAEVLAPRYREEALKRAEQLEPTITELKGNGFSLAKIAAELNKRKIATPRGGQWDHSSVRNVLKRIAA
jgi:Recombinase